MQHVDGLGQSSLPHVCWCSKMEIFCETLLIKTSQNNDKFMPYSITSNGNELFEYPEQIIQSLLNNKNKENHKSQRNIVRIDY